MENANDQAPGILTREDIMNDPYKRELILKLHEELFEFCQPPEKASESKLFDGLDWHLVVFKEQKRLGLAIDITETNQSPRKEVMLVDGSFGETNQIFHSVALQALEKVVFQDSTPA